MRKLLLLLLLALPASAFGQTFTGSYRAMFFNFFSEPRRIVIDFEVRADNSLVAVYDPEGENRRLTGSVEKNGKFVAASEPVGDSVLKLSGKFGKDNKVSFIRRTQTGSGMNRSVSENGIEGTFAKFVPPPPRPTTAEIPPDGKSLLKLGLSTPLFGGEWTEMTARIIYETASDGVVRRFDIIRKTETQEQRLQITTRTSRASERAWQTDGFDVTFASYREIDRPTAKRQSFASSSETYKENAELQNGTVEIVEDVTGRIAIRLTNFRIKRIADKDFVEINGIVYTEPSVK